MTPSLLLTLAVLLPACGAFLSLAAGRAARWVGLACSLVTLGIAAWVIGLFINRSVADLFSLDIPLFPVSTGVDVRFHLGLDGIGLWLFGLTALLFVSSVLVSWEAIEQEQPLFYCMLLLLETGCLGVFTARDILVFYIFFEFTLIPLFLLIGIWGSEERRRAAGKFFLYTLAGSVLTFLSLLTMVLWVARHSDANVVSFDIVQVTQGLNAHPMPWMLQLAVFWALFAGFAIKVPLFPLHTWLPLAHVQAPTAGSVILAGILLKIGTYGFLRFSLPMLPEATAAMAPILIWLSVAGIIYGALVALVQPDMKRLIAYSSVSHLGFCMLGLFALNRVGAQGALLQMINHGISTGALFAIVGMLYERYHTRQISELGGLARQLPWLTFFMVLFSLSSIGLPGLNGFTGEILVLLGMFQRAWSTTNEYGLRLAAVLALSGVVLGAWYLLWLVQRVFFGPAHVARETHTPAADLNLREFLALAPLAVFVFWIGLAPNFFTGPTQATLFALVEPAEMKLSAARSPSPSHDMMPTHKAWLGSNLRSEPVHGTGQKISAQLPLDHPPRVLGANH